MNNFKPVDISVCLVTYNHQKYITDCIESVINQSGTFSMEIIVGVDDSPDNTLALVQKLMNKYPGRIKLIHHKPRLGYGSMNSKALFQLAKGRYIAYLDGDDYWLPGKLARQIDILDGDSKLIACYTNAWVENGQKQITGLFNNHTRETIEFKKLLMSGNFLTYSSLVFRRQLLPELIELDTPYLDYKVNLVLARSGGVHYLKAPLTVYRYESANSLRLKRNDRTRELYWQSMTSEIDNSVDQRTLVISLSQFLRSVFFRSLRTSDVDLLLMWFKIVAKRYQIHPQKLILYTVSAVFTHLIKETAGRLLNWREKVLYRI